MVEIMVVAALSSAILLSAMVVMSRTGRTFQKGTDLMNTQVLLESIVTQLRDDVRRLRSLVPGPGSCDDHHLTFQAWLRDAATGDLRLRKVAWAFDPQTRTLTRRIDDDVAGQRDFHGPGQVVQTLFRPDKDWNDFRSLTVVIQVNAERIAAGREEERATKAGSRLAITCQFQPKCQEPLSSFASTP
ncbi:MAG: hypothetical protein OZSIB_1822 [Candidatus Ozemobacter sibiricus]|jgi:hypothetical protein|uniref:Uncharacterized protein n=1 Tax=Candidatus Ozemobacter sibiricus TaxID=2268124 RepID=A0A367ZIX9_9BACT|nr:MAG: hypothetical protein OZSIB_1822 [Candidatus Ozemobacter sibiricus]